MATKEGITYEAAGVNIAEADRAKEEMAKKLAGSHSRVLNSLGAFSSLVDGKFDDYKHPVLVLKMEEPGTKQLLAAKHGRLPDVGYDLVNHLLNDIVVMGAKPLAVLDTIVCGKLERETVVALVGAIADACRKQGCDLVGGETSEQPRVIPNGAYILSASALGVVDKAKIIDGSTIEEGDEIVAIASNGLHTNGYSLVRSLLDRDPLLENTKIEGETFLDLILRPHLCYSNALQKAFANTEIHGLAHITGGGIPGNLVRVLPEGLTARIENEKIEILPVFKKIHDVAGISDGEMLKTYNLGVGIAAVLPRRSVAHFTEILEGEGFHVYSIGTMAKGPREVQCRGNLRWE